MQDYTKLKIWQLSHQITLEIYRVSKELPKEEQFGLVSQMRRCAVSVPANIAEGSGKSTQKNFSSFIDIAFGSISELEYYLYLCHELKYIDKLKIEPVQQDIIHLKKMLVNFNKKLKTKN